MSRKVLIVVEGLDSGGIENYLLRFLKEKNNEFETIQILCKSGRTGVLESEFLDIPKVTVTRFKLGLFNVSQQFRFYKYLRRSNPDSIIDFTGHFGGIPISIAKLASIRNRIIFYRSSTDRFQKSPLKDFFVRVLKYLNVKNCTWLLSNSEAAFINYYPNIYKTDKRFKVIYNGINPREFQGTNEVLSEELGIKKEDFVIGHIGRLNEAKNHNTILKVAIQLCNKYPNVKFVCCGLNVETLNQSVPSNLKNNIYFLPFRRDVKNVLTILDCYYFPSLTEGNPNALIEAMLFNIPIVASNIGPIVECMPQETKDNLVDPLDDVAACNLLKEYINGKPLSFDYKDWALNKFDYSTLFNEFLQTINR